MRKSRIQRQRDRRNIIWGIVLIGIVMVIAGGATYFQLTSEAPVDQKTMCPPRGANGHLILLVDKTDPLNFIQKQAFNALLDEVITQKVAPGELLSVFILGEDYLANAKPILELCNPGDGGDKSDLTANIKRLQKQYEKHFRDPIFAIANDLQSTRPAKASPILELVQLAAINGFRAHSIDGPRRLVIVSDMLHNTPSFSMYSRAFDYETFAKSPYGRKMLPSLPKVEVELQYVLNDPKLQTRRHLKFWEDYFQNAGARIVIVRPLEG